MSKTTLTWRVSRTAFVWPDRTPYLDARFDSEQVDVQAAVAAWPRSEKDLALLVWSDRSLEASEDDAPPIRDGRIASVALYRLQMRPDPVVRENINRWWTAPLIVDRRGDTELVVLALSVNDLADQAWAIWYGELRPSAFELVDSSRAWHYAADAGAELVRAFTYPDAHRATPEGKFNRPWVVREAARRVISADVRMCAWAWLAGALWVEHSKDPVYNEHGKPWGEWFPGLDIIKRGHLGKGFTD